jgi:hypothetical protein
MAQVQEKMNNKLKTKEFGDSQLVVALVLIAVALGLCLMFRTEIKAIMSNLFGTISTQINNLATEATRDGSGSSSGSTEDSGN